MAEGIGGIIRRDNSASTRAELSPVNPASTNTDTGDDFSDVGQIPARLKGLSLQVEDLERRVTELNKIKTEVEGWPEKLEATRVQFIESLGAFVAFFTFVSVDFQLFRNVQDWSSAVCLALVSAGLLLTFVLLIDYIMAKDTKKGLKKGWVEKHKFRTLLLISVGLIVLGLGFFTLSRIYLGSSKPEKEPEPTMKAQIEARASSSVMVDVGTTSTRYTTTTNSVISH